MRFLRLRGFFGWVSVVVALVSVQGNAASSRSPNIVFILADDLGWTDLGCTGSRYYETPHIDRLAREGLRFEAFYVYQNCAPTRAALMSGQYAPRTGVYTVNTLERGKAKDRAMVVPPNVTQLPLDRTTVAQVLQGAGYVTGMFGKWHLGTRGEYHPSRRGFEEAIVSNGKHFNFKTTPPTETPREAYLADYLTDLSVSFIERHHEKPFFLYLPHFAVHSPYDAKPEWIAKFKPKAAVGGHRSPVYAAMIASVDESVGRVLDCLDTLGVADETVVVFSSDNGGVGGYYATEPDPERRGVTDNAPLRGGKGTLYEGGIRVPFFVRWPKVIRPGRNCETPGAHVDLLPTFAALAGAELPSDQPLDGISLVPLFRDPERTVRRDIYWHFPGYLESYVRRQGWRTTPVGVIRSGPFKLMEFFEEERLELYDLRNDLGEKHNLAAQHPDQARELQGRLAQWRIQLDAAMPTRK